MNIVNISCPVCGGSAELRVVENEIPYFGKVMLTSISCSCGFRHNDCILLNVNNPIRYKIRINKDNLYVKVIRSTSGTIKIPEIGVVIEPGPASQAFVTNIEGVLDRVKDIVLMAMRWRKDENNFEAVERCKDILKLIDGVINGNEELTLIIEDPFGNSLIASTEAEKEELSEEEARNLKTGTSVIDIADLNLFSNNI